MYLETPAPRIDRLLANALQIDPLCEIKEIFPFLGNISKVACKLFEVLQRPAQFGPIIRVEDRSISFLISSSNFIPSNPISLKPAKSLYIRFY